VRAYVDESVRVAPPGLYLMAAVVVPATAACAVREALTSSLRRGARRFHWHHESLAGKAAMLALIRDLEVEMLVTYAAPVAARNPDRARRRALLRLFWELDQRGVRDVLLESRGERRDTEDRRCVAQGRRAGWAPEPVRYDFAKPAAECLLWLPDAVAGATMRALADGDDAYLTALGPRVTVVEA
jgi:hypothetical protein